MHVNPLSSHGLELWAAEQPATARVRRDTEDKAVFSQTQGLHQALNEAPDVRQGAVDRAKGLISSLKYPPDDLIDRISQLVARRQKGSDA
jgi:hypothetical protein